MGLKSGDYDAVLPMAPAAENLAEFALPLKRGAADPARSVGEFTVRVVRRAGTRVSWDGMAFSHLNTPVMALPGQLIVREKLKAMGTLEDASTPYAQSILRKLVMGRRDAAVLPAGFVQTELASDEFRGAVEVLPLPLMSAPSFLGFNREFQRREPAYVEALWAGIGQARGAAGGKPLMLADLRK